MSFCSKAITANTNGCAGNLGGITAIKITPVGTSAVSVDLEVIPESSHFESTFAYTASTGVGVWTTNVFIKLGEISAANKTAIDSMTLNNVTLELTLGNGNKVTVGSATLPAYATGGNLISGTALEDDHGFDLTFTAKSAVAPTVTDANA